MPGRKYLLLSIACFWVFGLVVLVANNFYWSAAPSQPAGEYILFHRVAPAALGHVLWVAMYPLVVGTPLAGSWFAYRFVRAWRAGRKAGVCRVCGYDLRASPDRCPECGTPNEISGRRG
jgi:hypothetical protein